MPMMNGVYLLLGTNLGNRGLNLLIAMNHIRLNGNEITKQSAVYQTAAWGIKEQPVFYNIALEISTRHTPVSLLQSLKNIEKDMGRKQTQKWGERLIDIDILYYNDQIIDEESLNIPHPQIPFRRFTLVPMVEIAPDFIHPHLRISQKDLLKKCKDMLEVKVVEDENFKGT